MVPTVSHASRGSAPHAGRPEVVAVLDGVEGGGEEDVLGEIEGVVSGEFSCTEHPHNSSTLDNRIVSNRRFRRQPLR